MICRRGANIIHDGMKILQHGILRARFQNYRYATKIEDKLIGVAEAFHEEKGGDPISVENPKRRAVNWLTISFANGDDVPKRGDGTQFPATGKPENTKVARTGGLGIRNGKGAWVVGQRGANVIRDGMKILQHGILWTGCQNYVSSTKIEDELIRAAEAFHSEKGGDPITVKNPKHRAINWLTTGFASGGDVPKREGGGLGGFMALFLKGKQLIKPLLSDLNFYSVSVSVSVSSTLRAFSWFCLLCLFYSFVHFYPLLSILELVRQHKIFKKRLRHKR